MKKILILLFLVALTASLQAQRTMEFATFYDSYVGVATDTASAAGTWSKYITINKGDAFYYDAQIKITEVSATTSTAVALQGRKFDTDAWSTITTVTYKGTGTDTTITYTANTNKVFCQ